MPNFIAQLFVVLESLDQKGKTPQADADLHYLEAHEHVGVHPCGGAGDRSGP